MNKLETSVQFKLNILHNQLNKMADEEQCRDDDFRAYLQRTVSAGKENGHLENIEETLTEPHIGSLVEHVKSFKTEMESSFEKERTGMTSRFKNEKEDILKGFLLEKKILNQEHESEKNNLLHSFVKERQKMLSTFEQQVKEIETDLLQKNELHIKSKQTTLQSTQKAEKKKTQAYKQQESIKRKSSDTSLGIRREGAGNHVDEVMRDVSKEKMMICEREKTEQEYYRKLERIKEELEREFNQNLRREREKKEEHVTGLYREIENLKKLKTNVADTWKEQASKLEEEFQKEREQLARHYKEEREKIRKKLEERNELKLDAQRQEYDDSINKLKTELQRIKSDAMKKGHEANYMSIQQQNELIRKLQENFDQDTKVIRGQNDKLTNNIKSLTSEKYELTRQIRELHDKLERETKSGTEMSSNMKKEFSTKMKCLLSDNEKLKNALKNNDIEKENLNRKLRQCCRNAKDNVEKISLGERTIAQCEDTITSMRNENKNLSHEINLLRSEKDDLISKIDKKLESERTLNIDITRLHAEIQDWNNKYALLEREKLQNEKLTAKIRKEAETHLSNYTQCSNKIEAFENEANKLRQLYENERKENIRLHERFTQDAELIRKKDAENANIRLLLDNIKNEFEGLKGKIEYDNDKIIQIESEKHSLENLVQKLKSAESVHVKHEILAVQNKYVKEFAKRLDYVKSNYEREIENLKAQIGDLKNTIKKSKDKENQVNKSCRCDDAMCNKMKSENPPGRYVSSHLCTDIHCNETSLHNEDMPCDQQNDAPTPNAQRYNGSTYDIPDLVNIPKVSDLYNDFSGCTSSSNGSTISSGELPTRDWENNDNGGQTHTLKKDERIIVDNPCECAQYEPVSCYPRTPCEKATNCSQQKKSTNSSQTSYPISLMLESTPGTKGCPKFIDLPTRPDEINISNKKKINSGQHNSEVSSDYNFFPIPIF